MRATESVFSCQHLMRQHRAKFASSIAGSLSRFQECSMLLSNQPILPHGEQRALHMTLVLQYTCPRYPSGTPKQHPTLLAHQTCQMLLRSCLVKPSCFFGFVLDV